MKITIPKSADVAQFEITAPHNPDNLVVTVDGEVVTYGYANNTIELEDLVEGQTVEITENTPHTIEGEAPIETVRWPTWTTMKFRINSLDPLPQPEDND